MTTTSIEIFEQLLSKRTIKGLQIDGVYTVEELLKLDIDQLLRLRHTGRRTLNEVGALKDTIQPA